MQLLLAAMRRMISLSDEEWNQVSPWLTERSLAKLEYLSQPGEPANEVYFICSGLLRVTVTDIEGTEHSQHFALEHFFVADYASYLRQEKAGYALQALEPSTVIVLPRKAIEWGYAHWKEGQKLGRLIAEYYFSYQDNRLKGLYNLSVKERYDQIQDIFPNILNRVPQHMIASYLGISPVHLSRLRSSKNN
jgi:CRP-like cAMP-binding protein